MTDYELRLEAEGRKWGDHLRVEASGEWHAWLDHPLICEHYRERGLVDGLPWQQWVAHHLGRPARRSLDLGCGSGQKSASVFEAGSTLAVEGIDISGERVAEAERKRRALAMPGEFRVADVNVCRLQPRTYDLIFASHSFHHFVELEHIMREVHEALTDDGLFILEEFVGPTQFQWTDQQIDTVRSLMTLLPESYRKLRWNATKPYEGRPSVAEVVAVSPFESIRSSEIVPLFLRHFEITAIRRLGGTLQHLLYNGIVHNFSAERERASEYVRAIFETEDALIDHEVLPSDFMLLIGTRRRG